MTLNDNIGSNEQILETSVVNLSEQQNLQSKFINTRDPKY